jgi:hypothetical protein
VEERLARGAEAVERARCQDHRRAAVLGRALAEERDRAAGAEEAAAVVVEQASPVVRHASFSRAVAADPTSPPA